MMETGKTQSPSVANLAGARLPADQGLSSLGLLMQLAGSVFLGVMAWFALMPIFAGGAAGSETWYMFLLGASGAVRSAFHRSAGSALLYGAPGLTTSALRSVRTYVLVSAIATVLWAFVIIKMGAPVRAALPIIGVLVAWPVTLLVLSTRPRYAAAMSAESPPQGEDMGFEGAAVLMLILGVIGALFSGLMLFTFFKLPSAALTSPQALLMIGVFIMLLVRSIMQANAGLRGSTMSDAEAASEAANRYYSFGIVSSIIAAGAMLVLMMMTALHPIGLLMVGALLGWLLVWPVALRRFYTEKNFSVLLAGKDAPNYRRAPDAGMTALGWLLLAFGALGLGSGVPSLIAGDLSAGPFGGASGGVLANDFSQFGHSAWWGIGISGVQLWAGVELTRMSDRFRLAANIYGVVAAATTLYLMWPMFKQLESMSTMLGGNIEGPMKLLGQGFVAMGLVIPIVTIVLANRRLTPQATARIAPPRPQ